MSFKNIFLGFALLFFFASHSASFAALKITEIMYAPNTLEDEWVEIFNEGTEVIDIGKWIINDGTNHALENSVPIPAGGRVIIADSKDAFSAAYPSVPVFSVSALSFNDGGDTIVLKDTKGVVYDSVSYTTSPSALKNGKSLQLLGGLFYAGTPSPGKETLETIQNESAPAATTTTPSSQSNGTPQAGAITYLTPYRPWPADQYMYASFGGPKVGVAGGEILFEGRLISAEKKPVPAADLYWTFGDGGMEKGKNVKHIYKYPGEYYTTLTATYGENIAEDMAKITIISPDISLSRVSPGGEGFVEIFNETKEVLDLSGWVLEQGGVNGLRFVIPKNTKIFGETKVLFPAEITKLILATTTVSLYFPNTKLVAEYKEFAPQGVSEAYLQKSNENAPLNNGDTVFLVPEVFNSQEDVKISPSLHSEEKRETLDLSQKEESFKKNQEDDVVAPETYSVAAVGETQDSSLKMFGLYGTLSFLIILFIVLISFKEKKEDEEGVLKKEAESYEIIE